MSSSGDRHFNVRATRSGKWWAITVDQLDGVFSQARRLDQVESMAREAIALALDVEPPEVGHISMEVIPPANVVDLLSTIDQAIATADEANAVVASTRREAAERLRLAGLPVRDVGHLLGLSHQRVSQILAR